VCPDTREIRPDTFHKPHYYQELRRLLRRPSLPLAWFDLCIAPSHDFPDGCGAANVILTRGAINRVTCGAGEEKSGKLILIGGPSKTHGWDGWALLEMLAKATDCGGWELTDSRRTPEGFLDQVRTCLPGVTAFSHKATPAEWVPQKLRNTREVWVTEDSVSMIYEAPSGARLGLLPVPRIKSESRVLSGIDRLVADGYLTPFSAWRESQRISHPPEILREADRSAELLLASMFKDFVLPPG
jgi:mitochondrial fission protein ELM1